MIVVIGIWLISFSSILPRVDDPETAYDETETPVNLTTFLNLSTVTSAATGANPATRVRHPVTISRGQRACWEAGTTIYAVTAKRGARVSRSRLNLLCALLC